MTRRSKPSGWRRWVERPQTLAWRRTLQQIHLWIGVGLGMYVVVLSVTGSAVVLRPDFHRWLIVHSVPAVGTRLAGAELESAVRNRYANYTFESLREQSRPDSPVIVALVRDGQTTQRVFDPYAARDLGPAYPPILSVVEWVVDLHDNLLARDVGRTVNGVGALLLLALLLTGAVLWWPGRARWHRGLTTGRPEKSRRFAYRLHNALGFWSFALLFVWTITAVYFAFPEPFDATINYFDAHPSDSERPGDAFVMAIIRLHFGRFGGMPGRIAWIVLGLTPAILFVTGFIMWWTRVVRRRLRTTLDARLNSNEPVLGGNG